MQPVRYRSNSMAEANEVPEEVAELDEQVFAPETVPPGITGLWQARRQDEWDSAAPVTLAGWRPDLLNYRPSHSKRLFWREGAGMSRGKTKKRP